MAAPLVLLVADQSKDRFVRQNETTVIVYGINNFNASNNDEDINTASTTRTVYTTNDVIKKEALMLSTSFCRPPPLLGLDIMQELMWRLLPVSVITRRRIARFDRVDNAQISHTHTQTDRQTDRQSDLLGFLSKPKQAIQIL